MYTPLNLVARVTFSDMWWLLFIARIAGFNSFEKKSSPENINGRVLLQVTLQVVAVVKKTGLQIVEVLLQENRTRQRCFPGGFLNVSRAVYPEKLKQYSS